ncbi:MAG: hypothetical protein K2R98_13925 [Gemmataceae bacterium]|nr:hypothetical protein [Gemmataceae bacterium]
MTTLSQTASLNELAAALMNNGVTDSPVRIATALLGVARQNEWNTSNPQRAVGWLSQLALDTLRNRSRDVRVRDTPALDDLDERLLANGVKVDGRRVAAAVLGLASERDWNGAPVAMGEWLERLAIEVATAS